MGILNPEMKSSDALLAGQVGYVICNMKSVREARVGDTFYIHGKPVTPEAGFEKAKPMVFCGIYPENPDEYNLLEKSIYKLALADPAAIIEKENCSALGNGFRCGFLGLLHMDVFRQRLTDEFQVDTMLTSPSVSYLAKLKDGKVISRLAHLSEWKPTPNAPGLPPPSKKTIFISIPAWS